MQIHVRPEQPSDIDAIWAVNAAAFERPNEADLVTALRDNGNALISLVASVDGAIVGHILVSPATVSDGDTTWHHVAIGPVAAMPDLQKQGIGRALMQAAMGACHSAEFRAIFLLGHTTYYPRFGFHPARNFDIYHADFKSDAFMAVELVAGALDNVRGTMQFSPEFANA